MGKRDNIKELAVFITQALAHRIGRIIDENALHAEKYRKETLNFMKLAEQVKMKENWNSSDLILLRETVKNNLERELARRTYIDNRKFDIMGEEIEKVLRELELSD